MGSLNSIILDLYFVDEPTDADVVPGGTIQFNCRAKHKDTFIPNVQWLKDDQVLETNARIQNITGGRVHCI